MAITVGSTVTEFVTSSTGTTQTFAHTVDAGDDRLLIVYGGAGGAAQGNIVSASYNGVAMTLGPTYLQGSSVSQTIWYLVNPPTGTHNVVLTGGSIWTNGGWKAVNLYGVNQSSPVASSFQEGENYVQNPWAKSVTVPPGGRVFHATTMTVSNAITPESGAEAFAAFTADDSKYQNAALAPADTGALSWSGFPDWSLMVNVGIVLSPASGSSSASADGGTATITVTGTGGEATGGTSGTNASADGGTGTITVTGTGGEATATATGSFTTDAMENNTGAGLLASVAVVWTWYKGAIGTAPTSTTHGTGTTNSSGVITATGLPAGAGFILVETADGGVYYQPGTVS